MKVLESPWASIMGRAGVSASAEPAAACFVRWARSVLVFAAGLALGGGSGGCADPNPPGRTGAPTVAETSEAVEGAASGTVREAATAGPRIVFLGTSLTAGYGLDDPELAYPARLGVRMAEAGWRYQVVNAGVSGDTSAGGRTRLPGLLELHGDALAALFVELGANDGLRGRSPDALRENLEWIVRETRRRRPEAGIVVAGMEAPPNLGPLYTDAFRDAYRQVVAESGAHFVPFLLEGVAAVPELNQSDGIHPNAEGHEAVAAVVWSGLAEWLAARCEADGAC